MLLPFVFMYSYITTRNITALIIIPALVLATYFINPFLHLINEIHPKQYANIRIILNKNPQLIPIIPNYVNSKCHMTPFNYDKIIALSHNLNSISMLSDLPRNKTESDIKKMCALTIFRT